jgi:GNAT superfamily N-acetyltransferase
MAHGETTPPLSLYTPPLSLSPPPPPLMERMQQQLAMMQQQQHQAMAMMQLQQQAMMQQAAMRQQQQQQAMIQQALSLPTHPSLIELERMEQQLAMMQQQQAMAMMQLQQQLQQQLAMMQQQQQAMAMMQQQQQAMMQQSAMTLWREQQQQQAMIQHAAAAGHDATATAAGHDATAAAESLHLALRPPCDGVDCMYPCALQTVSSLSTASRMELEMLLAEGIGLSPRYQLWDELYTVTYGNKIVACVFLKTVDLHALKARYHDPNLFGCRFCECCWSEPVAGPSGGGKVLHVGALTVSSEHRGQGIASRLLKLIKKKASKDRMLWIQLQATWEEKEDMSELHRQHGFIDARGFIERLYDAKFSVLLALCMGLHPRLGQHSPLAALQDDVLQSICSRLTASELGDEGSPFAAACTKHIREGLRAYDIYTSGLPYETKGLLINDGDGQINFEKFVYDCISEKHALLYLSHSRLLSGATGKVTWTGLFFPEWRAEVIENKYGWYYGQNMERDPDSDLDDLDRERDYREQQRERVSRKKIRTQARIQTRAHIGYNGGKNAGTGGAALDLRELLADLFY